MIFFEVDYGERRGIKKRDTGSGGKAERSRGLPSCPFCPTTADVSH